MSNARDTAKNLKTGLNVAATGDIIDLQKDGTTVGNVGVEFTDNLFIGGNSSHCTLGFGTSAIYPTDGNSGGSDADTDLGSSANRFKDLYLSGGVYLGGTTATNHLDDYEKGDYTYTIYYSTSNYIGTSMSTLTNTGAKYTKIGRTVIVNYPKFAIATGLNNAVLYRYSLPFVADANGTGSVGETRGASFRYNNDITTSTTSGPYSFFFDGDSYISFGFTRTDTDYSGYVYYPSASGSSWPSLTVVYQTT